MLLFILGQLPVAQAKASSDAAMPCANFMDASLPINGAHDVPIDGAIPVALTQESCGGNTDVAPGTDIAFELHRQAHGAPAELVASVTGTVLNGRAKILRLVPTAPMLVDTAYVVTGADGTGSYGTFTTGERSAAGMKDEALSGDATATSGGCTPNLLLNVDVTPVQDPDGLSILRISDPESGEVLSETYIDSSADNAQAAFDYLSANADQACVSVEQEDGLGNVSDSIEVCADTSTIEPGNCALMDDMVAAKGCATSGQNAMSWLVVAGAVAAFGSRRRQGHRA